MFLHGVSKAQQPDNALQTITTRRLGVILLYQGKFCLEVNTTPGYGDMTSFFNTTLSNNPLEQYEQEVLISRAKDLIHTRAGYKHIQFVKLLHGDIMWNFHKPDKNYNELGLYHDSIIVCRLEDDLKDEVDPAVHRTIQWFADDELTALLKEDGSNGSSFLIKQLYDKNNQNDQ